MSEFSFRRNEIRSVLIPLEFGQLLLPNAAVAEVVGYQEPEPYPEPPHWLLGALSWRQCRVPLISFDQLVGRAIGQTIGHRARVAICHTQGGNADRPYIGVLASGIPRLIMVNESALVPAPDSGGTTSGILRQVLVGGEEASIPDLDLIEWRVGEALGE